MADWYKCIDLHDQQVLINLSMATQTIWKDSYTMITFAGGNIDSVNVKGEPEEIFRQIRENVSKVVSG